MSLSPFDSFQSRFVTYLLNFPRIYVSYVCRLIFRLIQRYKWLSFIHHIHYDMFRPAIATIIGWCYNYIIWKNWGAGLSFTINMQNKISVFGKGCDISSVSIVNTVQARHLKQEPQYSRSNWLWMSIHSSAQKYGRWSSWGAKLPTCVYLDMIWRMCRRTPSLPRPHSRRGD